MAHVLGPALLSVVLVVFVAVSLGCVMEVLQLRRKMIAEDENTGLSRSGIEMRLYFHLLLLFGNSTRAVALVCELLFFRFGICPASLLCINARMLPNLFFLTTYSLLTLFWAQLTYQVMNKRFTMLKPLFLLYNVLLFAAYGITTLASLHGVSPDALELALSYLLGAFYLVVLLFLAYYGSSVAFHFHSSNCARGGQMLKRLVALCVLCAVIIAMHVVYFLGSAMRIVQWRLGFPSLMDDQVFDALAFTALELGPSVAILITMHQRKPATPSQSGNTAMWSDPAQEPLRMTEMPAYAGSSVPHTQHTMVQPSASPFGNSRDNP